jgi:hypothetical protein
MLISRILMCKNFAFPSATGLQMWKLELYHFLGSNTMIQARRSVFHISGRGTGCTRKWSMVEV